MKFHEADFLRFEHAVRRGTGGEPTALEMELARDLAQRAVGDERDAVIAFTLAVRGDADVTFDADGVAIVHVRADQLDELVAEIAAFAVRRYAN
jgi:hypothetical protein